MQIYVPGFLRKRATYMLIPLALTVLAGSACASQSYPAKSSPNTIVMGSADCWDLYSRKGAGYDKDVLEKIGEVAQRYPVIAERSLVRFTGGTVTFRIEVGKELSQKEATKIRQQIAEPCRRK